jgi:transcriptional regulator with XRE-family HTH domain
MPAPANRRAREVMQQLGGNVQRLRRIKRLTQQELAELAGLDLSYTQRVERGQVNVTLGTLVTFADALKVSPGALLKVGKAPVIRRGRPPENVRIAKRR